MKVKDLIAKLKTVDPEIQVVREGSEHSYDVLRTAYQTFAEKVGRDYLGEYYDDDSMSDGAVKVEVFLIGV